MVICPSVESILLLRMLWSSWPSAPISDRSVKIVANFGPDAEIIFVTLSVLGIIGVPSGTL